MQNTTDAPAAHELRAGTSVMYEHRLAEVIALAGDAGNDPKYVYIRLGYKSHKVLISSLRTPKE